MGGAGDKAPGGRSGAGAGLNGLDSLAIRPDLVNSVAPMLPFVVKSVILPNKNIFGIKHA
jgi:hypothetical protein